MNHLACALLITVAGALGGIVNALLTDNGFVLPQLLKRIWCPGFISNILIGAFSAFASWSFYGSGAGVELAANTNENSVISLTFSALAGAFLVGVAGSRWLTNEVDKKLLRESVKEATKKKIGPEEADELIKESPRSILKTVDRAITY